MCSTGCSINPWDPQRVAELQLDFVELVTTLWAQQLSQFSSHLSVHIIPIHQLFNKDMMGNCIKSLTKIKVNNIHCLFHILQLSFFMPESMKIISHHSPFVYPCWLLPITFLYFMCLEMAFRIICSIIFPGVEMRLVSQEFPRLFPLALFEEHSGVYFLPVLWKFVTVITAFQKLSVVYIIVHSVFISVSRDMFSLFPCIIIYFISSHNTIMSRSLKSWNSFRFQTQRKVVWPKPCL